METFENNNALPQEQPTPQEMPVAEAPAEPAPSATPPAEPAVTQPIPPVNAHAAYYAPPRPAAPAQQYNPNPQYAPRPQYVPQQQYAPVYQPVYPVRPPQPKRRSGPLVWVLTGLVILCLILQVLSIGTNLVRKDIQDARINEKGELVLTYSNGRQENLGTVVGQDGLDGSDGKDGTTTVVGEEAGTSVAITSGLRSSVSIYCTYLTESMWGASMENYSAGSGVIYQMNKASGDALIITNYHVVYDSSSRSENGIAEDITVYLYGSEVSGMEMKATYVGGSMYYDLAVLHVKGSDILKNSDATPVSIANSDEVQVGSTAIAIGNAEGSGISATSGVVSVDSEHITMTASDGFTAVDYRVMRIDTAVNQGNSGGGLFDKNGKLIGIVNAKTMEDGVENIGYALPSTVVVAVVDNIIDYCYGTSCENVMRPLLGVTVATTASNAVYDEESGMLTIVDTVEIHEVESGKLGSVFQVGDVLVSAKLNGTQKTLTRQHHIIDLLLTARVGDVVEFTVLRGGVETNLTVTITQDCLTSY